MKLKDRVAVITGAGSGIGRASALEFAKEGARVVVADINRNGAVETVKRIEQAGGQAHAVTTDVADAASVQNLVRETLRFDPPLPGKQAAAQGLPLGLADKLYLAVDRPEDLPVGGHLFGDINRTGDLGDNLGSNEK